MFNNRDIQVIEDNRKPPIIEDNKEEVNEESDNTDNEEPIILDINNETIPAKGDVPNIYIFWGNGCPHCESLKFYLLNLYPNYIEGKYNIVSLEIWKHENNKELLSQFMKELNIEDRGVPLLVVGNEYVKGFSVSKETDVDNLLKNNLNTDIDVYWDYIMK